MLLDIAHAFMILSALTVQLGEVRRGECYYMYVAHALLIFRVLTVQLGEVRRGGVFKCCPRVNNV